MAIWIMGTIYFAHSLSKTTTDSSPPLRQVQVPGQASPPPPPQDVVMKLQWQASKSKELIDMRDLTATLAFDNPDGGVWKQGWDVEPVPVDEAHPITIFVVPHSHCDPGWIQTFDDYFQSQVKHILSSVVESLSKDPRRKFIWAEISYFEWWWKEQDLATKQLVKKLLYDRQLEFVTGGWVQPDEANTQLYAMEIQLQEGHDFLRQSVGEEYIPKYAWSIDPFGYSPTMAYLLKKFHFQAMLIQRVHYAVKKELASKKHLEFLWRQTWDKTGEFDIFTHVMPFYSYDVPHTCGPDPSVCCQFDFARMKGVGKAGNCPWHPQPKAIHDNNVKERALLLLDQYRKKSQLYRSNVVIAPLGDDFRYQSVREADAQFENYQRMFDYLNKNVPGVSIQFGTLSDYFQAAMGQFEPPLLKGSFFTYADRDEDYWSGYFTSRVFDKALDRKLERVLYAATSMGATKQELQEPRRALSLFQHHDGVTGTAKPDVVQDYAKRIHNAIHVTQGWMIQNVQRNYYPKVLVNLQACWQSDAPRGLAQNLCESKKQVILYNPLETPQSCGSTIVQGRTTVTATLPCEVPGALAGAHVEFDPKTGLMTHPIQEEWMYWKVKEGGAYLFVPGDLHSYEFPAINIKNGGYVVETNGWKRTIVQKEVPTEFTTPALVFDFVYETFLKNGNQEWFVRLSSDINNQGVFHTDLNGYNFDTHHFRKDMPIQSQVFPMPTLASIQDEHQRITIISEHAQGTASLQEGSVDVWLDRRLNQDDNRGLGEGVKDNVPTRTRLRVVLEHEGYDAKNPEFEITPLTKRMWKELNHPLEMFGQLGVDHPQMMDPNNGGANNNNKVSDHTSNSTVYVPLVYMVFNRVDYLTQAMDSLRKSDFPRGRVPIIISHDGHIEEMVSFVQSLKTDFHVIQIFHPHSCYDHPHSFPGDDPKLNENYKGDTYGNRREAKVTCCKHHFTWLMNEVFQLDEVKKADSFLFMEEDYIVAPTIYSSVDSGVNLFHRPDLAGTYFGITLDPTEGYSVAKPPSIAENEWTDKKFVTGPMILDRTMYGRIKQNAQEYCTFDDYNW
jgi:alpha-mannosidase II